MASKTDISPSQPFYARFFADAAKDQPSNSFATHFFANVWTQRAALILQTFALPLAYYFRSLCIAVAAFWLIYRASQVLQKPLDELSSLLGLDIPLAPLVDLASIKADGAIVHWSLPGKQKQKSSLKYVVHLNGVVIGTIPVYETALTITGLQPASFYVVRVGLVNQLDLGTKSLPIRFRTRPAASGEYFVSATDGHETDNDGSQEVLPRIRPYRGLKDVTSAPPVSAPMARESSSGIASRRNTSGRRPSPVALGLETKHDSQPDDHEAVEGTENIRQLTEKLDATRREIDEAEKQAKEEEEEDSRVTQELTKERDEHKAAVSEREKASKNLKREVNIAERQNTAAQNERQKLERLLQQKKDERQKLKDDMVRWQREAEQMGGEVERIQQEKVKHLEQAAQEKDALRTRLQDETAKTRSLDEEVKEKTSDIRKIERALKNNSPNGSEPEPTLVQQLQNDADEDRQWLLRKGSLQQQYAMAYNKVESAKRFHADQMRYLESLRAERRRHEEMAAQFTVQPQTQERIPRRADSQRSRHAPSRHSVSDSPRLGTFPVNPSPFASSAVPAGFNSTPFLNLSNGMTLQQRGNPTDEVSMSNDDRDKLTGGAPMSPGAGAELLPADLFSSEVENRPPPPEHVQPLPGLGSLPGLAGSGPSAQTATQEHAAPWPVSPVSSRSPSVFASPGASQQNLHLGSPENAIIDADRRSIRSVRSSRATSGSGGIGSRFGGVLGIKQRNKTMSEDGPPLSKASSMPRQDQSVSGLDSATRKRNSSMSGTVFQSSLDGSIDGSSEASSAAPPPPTAKRAFNFFNREKSGGWPSNFIGRRPTSPRPVSTHSNELPRPSMDSSRWGVDTWPSGDASSGARNSPLGFGSGQPWAPPAPQQSRLFGSRHPSRRPSVQYGASGPPEDIMEDDDSDALDPDEAPHLDPIGTKRSKKAESSTAAKLNPNAKDFKSFFSSMKFSSGKDKGKESSSNADTEEGEIMTPVPSSSTTPNLPDDESPPASRKSRDTRSMTTTESSTAESGRNSNELARTPSHSASDAPAPSPSLAGSSKETLMQKISRKSSSSKFALPTFKREKSRLDTPTIPVPSSQLAPSDVDEESEGMSASLGSLREMRGAAEKESRDSREGSRSTRSWSSVLKLGKKKGPEDMSLSGNSVASDLDEEEEEGDEGEAVGER